MRRVAGYVIFAVLGYDAIQGSSSDCFLWLLARLPAGTLTEPDDDLLIIGFGPQQSSVVVLMLTYFIFHMTTCVHLFSFLMKEARRR